MKDQLRWGKSPVRGQAGQTAHLHLCLMAYCLLELEVEALQVELVRQIEEGDSFLKLTRRLTKGC